MDNVFIAIDGIDGCGKTTQVAMLKTFMDEIGLPTVTVYDPGTTPTGLSLRKIMLDKDIPLNATAQALLFTASRAALADEVRDLMRTHSVIADRWVTSTLAYQGSMLGVGIDRVLAAHNTFVHTDPAVIIVLDVPYEVAGARLDTDEAKKDRFESKSPGWHKGLAEVFRGLSRSLNRRLPVRRINADHNPDIVHREIVMTLIAHCPPFATAVADRYMEQRAVEANNKSIS